MNSRFRTFFSTLKSSIPPVSTFITGVSPVVLSEITSGFNVARDITLQPNFSYLYGFTSEDVNLALKSITPKLNDTQITEIFQIIERNNNGYRFTPEQEVTLFNPNLMMHDLQEIQNILNDTKDGIKLSGEQLCKNIIEDTNTRPTKTTLDIFSYYSSSFVELLKQEKPISKLKLNYIDLDVKQDSPENMFKLMYYLGALTFSKKTDKDNYYLVIPNNKARTEFIEKNKKTIRIR